MVGARIGNLLELVFAHKQSDRGLATPSRSPPVRLNDTVDVPQLRYGTPKWNSSHAILYELSI